MRDRLRTHRSIGVMLSGGLDFGLSNLSRGAGAAGTRSTRKGLYLSALHDVAHTVDGNRFGDELPFASAVASFAGNVDLIEIRTADLTPIQAIRRSLQIHDEPKHTAGNAYWILDLLATASRDGVGTLLSGQGGNATISWTGMQFRQRMGRLMTERHWKAVIQRLIYPHIPIPMIRGLRHVLHDKHIDWSRTAICPEFASRIKLTQQYVEGTGTTSNPEEWHAPIRQRYATIMPGRSFGGSIWAEI